MLKINQKTNKIYLTKGDNAEITVSIYDKYNKPRQIFDDDVIELTVKDIATDSISLKKTAVNGKIAFVPEDTTSISVGIYKYDIQLTTFGGKIYTIVPVSYFEIGEEITI